MSEPLEQFKRSLNDRSMDWIDGYDLDAFSQLTGKERALAIQLMITALTKNDIRAPRAFALIKDQAFVEVLKQHFDLFQGTMRVETALTLHELEHDQAMDSEIIKVLTNGEEHDRRSAAYSLRHFNNTEVKNALLQAVAADRDRDVRLAATISLLLVSGLMEDELDMSHRTLIMKVTSADQSVRESGLAELKQKIGVPKPSAAKTPPQPEIPQRLETPERVCSKCNGALKAGAKFCGSCGTPVSAVPKTTRCPKCGMEFPPGAMFCKSCG